ncbi:MAG TPA: adenosylmethionine--8-amino-7-oxononanoate transaminase [Oligoflexus sp.]|uniref:adenosylmethionine--8-amino-7-oxononanoate transaminase n=1 Tax=Oligoflexus sp. TaxID=1971216 RepID=UPI002D7F94BD|nr:adenosylmethionine--8-amino-7-oxononanoate transaminase [Oligoflexus sp.]HET9239800.1 adenosylmethionine--8-amino-7-oxononanoate transaminase [Oligoflexus sp.]
MKLFVTGTGTDVGKTIVSAALMTGALRRGQPLQYWKPVQTGGQHLDRDQVHALCPKMKVYEGRVWSYPLPASPDQAARAAGMKAPTVEEIAAALHSDVSVLLEGAGGLLVPLNDENETWRDAAVRMELPVVLVASSGLGTLNHTLLTLEALDQAGLDVLAVIVNGPPHEANMQSLRRMRPDHRFVAFPWMDLSSPGSEWQKACEELFDAVIGATQKPVDISAWYAYDKKHCWHPYTQHQTAPEPLPLVKAQGIYLKTHTGEKLIDASASWWTNSTGHGHPKIGAALARQHRKIDHCIFAGATHEPASLLAKELVDLSQGQLPRVFYTDNGSCAVEVALKMAAQSWQNRGVHHRKNFLFFRGAYHGDTFGAMSVASTEGFHKAFSPYLFEGKSLSPVTSHASRLCPQGPAALPEGLKALENMFQLHGKDLAGVIIEPLVQGASGMNMQDITWLQTLGRLCREYQLPLILDEVFTGMGRLGSYFAFERAGLQPDIVCIAKGLTGGTLPLAVTLTSESMFEYFLDQDGSKAMLHGHTFTGNALACATALAALDIYRRERILDRVRAMEEECTLWIENRARAFDLVSPRAIGGILAFELPGSGPGDYFHPLAQKVPGVARRHGLLMRTLGNTMYFVPPLSIQSWEVRDALGRMERTLGDLHEGRSAE